MTVQELIDELNKIEDKKLQVELGVENENRNLIFSGNNNLIVQKWTDELIVIYA